MTTLPGWRTALVLTVRASEFTQLVSIVADDPHGLLVVGSSLAEALASLPGALQEFREAGARMPALEGVNLR